MDPLNRIVLDGDLVEDCPWEGVLFFGGNFFYIVKRKMGEWGCIKCACHWFMWRIGMWQERR